MAISTGIVTNFSISSALRPGHWVMMLISVLVTSGKASMGMFLNVMIPEISRIAVQKKMKYLFFNEKAIIFLSNLFIAEFFTVLLGRRSLGRQASCLARYRSGSP